MFHAATAPSVPSSSGVIAVIVSHTAAVVGHLREEEPEDQRDDAEREGDLRPATATTGYDACGGSFVAAVMTHRTPATDVGRGEEEPGQDGTGEHPLHGTGADRCRRRTGSRRRRPRRASASPSERPADRPPPLVGAAGQGEQQHRHDQHHEGGHGRVAVDHLLDRLGRQWPIDLEDAGGDQAEAGQDEQVRERSGRCPRRSIAVRRRNAEGERGRRRTRRTRRS